MRSVMLLAGLIASGLAAGGVRAQDVRIPLPSPPDVLAVDKDKAIDQTLRALPPAEAAPLVILDQDRIAAAPPAEGKPLMFELRGPVADRLFPVLPWTDTAAGTPIAAAPAPSPVELAIADTLKGAKPEARLGRQVIADIAQHYEARGFRPIWQDGVNRNAKAEEVLAALRTAEDDGLDIAAYAAPAPEDDSPQAIARADIALTRAVVAYARDARGARIANPAQLSKMIDAAPELPSADSVLSALEAAEDPAAILIAYNPQQPGYKALRKALAAMRGVDDRPADYIAVGKTLRLGQSDERIATLRRRLGVVAASDELLFDSELAEAVKEFQRANGIRATGILNPVTTAALNGEPINGAATGKATAADLISNMERWRWMPRELGYNHIFVNIPEFQLRIIENNAVTHWTRVVVGKPETQTPVFSDEVEFVVVNPTWTVPPSIALKEYLPKLRDNPYAMQNKGFEIVRRGKVIDPATVDWYDPPKDVAIRQPPGERNALGHIKFMFPNNHAVYLHDTPKKQYFEQDVRAESHGCVRVDDPFALAEMVLGDGWPKDRVERLIGGKRERMITLQRHMPVHLAYFTVTVGPDGEAQKFRDIYGHDAAVKRALGL